jgi:hypothetical protein
MVFFIVIAVKTSNLTRKKLFFLWHKYVI